MRHLVVREISPILDLLDRFDLAAAHDSNRVPVALEEVPESFPEFNTGVLAYRSSDAFRRVGRRWLELHDARRRPDHVTGDQAWLRQAVYESEIRVATLPPEFNCRIMMAGHYNLPVAILHSHLAREQFERVAEVAGHPLPVFWSQYVHLDAQIWGPLGSARKLLDLRPLWARHRLTRALVRVASRRRPHRQPRLSEATSPLPAEASNPNR